LQRASSSSKRRVFVGDPGGKFQAHAWDFSTGERWPVTDSETAVVTAAISPGGEWIYSMVEEEPGTEIGHVHRFSFSGGDSADMTPDLDPYPAYVIEPTEAGVVMLGGIGGGPAMIVAEDDQARVITLPSLPIGLVVLGEGSRAAVTLATPGRGLIPMLRVYHLGTGEVMAEMDEMAATATYRDLLAVAVVDGEWMRPAVWDGDALTPIDTDMPGDVVPADWSPDGSTILLSQTYRAGGAFYLYRVATGEVV
jgi:WD40 repeat protein